MASNATQFTGNISYMTLEFYSFTQIDLDQGLLYLVLGSVGRVSFLHSLVLIQSTRQSTHQSTGSLPLIFATVTPCRGPQR